MWAILASACLAAGPKWFERHDVDRFPAGYQVAVADLNRDGRPDIVALSTDADRVDWYENPGWRARPVARTPKNIDLAARDLDGDGRPEIVLASGFYFAESDRGGQIQWLGQPADADELWAIHPILTDPVVHRVRWADLDGDGRTELVHAPLFGAGSQGAAQPKPAHLWALVPPERLERGAPWSVRRIDESLTVLHGIHAADLDGDGRDELLTASFEGICRFDYEPVPGGGRWIKRSLSPGAAPADGQPGAPRGASEVAWGHVGGEAMLAAIEPWHGHLVVVYAPQADGSFDRHVIDDSLSEGHALVVADFDGDGADEIVAGWRGGGGGLNLYDPVAADEEPAERPTDAPSSREAARRAAPSFRVVPLDRHVAAEGAVAADINQDGRLDLVVIAGRSNLLAWYENVRKD